MSEKTPLVSCIIPTKNRPGLVVRAINSVIGQTHKNIEIIVVDDSTDDDTLDSISRLGISLNYIKNTDSKGACYSRNIGLREANGDVIAFLDDDDAWMPTKIEEQLKLLKHYPIVGCNSITQINGKRHYLQRPDKVTYKEMLYHNYLGSCSYVAVNATAMHDCYFDENLKSGQDWDMWLRIMKNGRIEEAGNSGSYLVDYNSGDHTRITNSVNTAHSAMTIYNKYLSEHTTETARNFFLYNMVLVNGSFMLWFLREFVKTKAKKKTLLFLVRTILKRIIRKTEYY